MCTLKTQVVQCMAQPWKKSHTPRNTDGNALKMEHVMRQTVNHDTDS